MRIPKAYLWFNGILMLAAIASWSWFFQKYTNRVDPKPPVYLGTKIPSEVTSIKLLPAGSQDAPIDLPSLVINKPFTATEVELLNVQMKMLSSILFASESPKDAHWKRIGEVRMTAKEGSLLTLQMYETPGQILGFGYDGKYYLAGPSSAKVVEFVKSVRKP